jgi:hypothetical protein
MENKNLPLRLIKKRDNDQLKNEASGGPKKKPKWLLPKTELDKKVRQFRQTFSSISARLDQKLKNKISSPSIVKVKLIAKASSKDHRKEIDMLFNTNRTSNIIGLVGDNELIIRINSASDLKTIEKNINNIAKFDVAISAIDETVVFKPEIKVDTIGKPIKIKLFHFNESAANTQLLTEFEKFCKKNKIRHTKLNYSKGLNIYQIALATTDMLNEFETFDGICSVTDMPIFDTSFDSVEGGEEVDFPKPLKDVDYPVVGVLDTGIESNVHLSDWKIVRRHTNFPDDEVDKRHGSMVSSVILFGDELQGVKYTGSNGCKLMEAIVYPAPGTGSFTEYLLLENIKEAVTKNKDIKIWNLSLGSKSQSDEFDFSDFAKGLDELQNDTGVLIVKSASNCDNYKTGLAKSRIARGADSIRSLVVGSLAQDKSETDISFKDWPSPFSRTGPGPSGIIKPELVHYGGNTGFDGTTERQNGVKVLNSTGNVSTVIGTSFSTPRISALAAGLSAKVKYDPLLIKALLLHSANYPAAITMDHDEKIKNVGFGLPSNIDDILNDDFDEATIIIQDTMEKGSFINIMDFPIPESMIDENGYYYGQVSLTLVTAPILDEGQGLQYCQSQIDVFFGSYDEKVNRDLTKKTVRNPIGTQGQKNLLHPDCYSKAVLKSANNSFRSHRLIKNFHGKFQPIKKWVINLEELKPSFKKKHLKAPKKWYLKMKAGYRPNIEDKGGDLSIPFVLIATIKDPKKKKKVYHGVTQFLAANNFIHESLKVQNTTTVKVKK